VKNYARKHPHSMGAWSPDSKTNVATWAATSAHNEKSSVIERRRHAAHRARRRRRHRTVLKESVPVLAGEVVDARS
jgi:isocitrate dehydrogenase